MIIGLKTSYSGSLGMGHIHRMCSLAWYLNGKKQIKTFIVSDAVPDSFPDELIPFLKDNFDFSPDIVIRDMRDSEEDEIILLKKAGKVITIDDNGSGTKHADHIIDILPNKSPHVRALEFNGFLYGFNFLKSLEKLKNKSINKKINFSIYPGNSATDEYKDYLISLLPKGSSYAVLCGKNSYLQRNGKRSPLKNSYAEIMLSSKIVITHFGITAYEAFISKCRTMTINPTKYHSELSDIVKERLNLINLGELKGLDSKDAAEIIGKTLMLPAVADEVNAGEVYEIILNGLEEFCNLIIGT